MKSFGDELQIAVIGAGGAIGDALVSHMANDASVGTIYALARNCIPYLGGQIVASPIDIECEASVSDAAQFVREASRELDIVFVATGILHSGDDLRPEKSWKMLEATAMARVFRVNSIGPALVAKYFLPLLRKNGKSVFAALSARVGSIEDNRLGGWYAYRASKAALNMTIKSLSVELARSRPDAVCVALHPGTVNSDLSKPFQGAVDANVLTAPSDCARNLIRAIDDLSAAESGGFFAYDGSPIPY